MTRSGAAAAATRRRSSASCASDGYSCHGRCRVQLPAQRCLGIVGGRRPGRRQRRDLPPILSLDGHVRIADMCHAKIAVGSLRRRDERENQPRRRAAGASRGGWKKAPCGRYRSGTVTVMKRWLPGSTGRVYRPALSVRDHRLAVGDRHTADPAAGSGVIDRATDGEVHFLYLLPPGKTLRTDRFPVASYPFQVAVP